MGFHPKVSGVPFQGSIGFDPRGDVIPEFYGIRSWDSIGSDLGVSEV